VTNVTDVLVRDVPDNVVAARASSSVSRRGLPTTYAASFAGHLHLDKDFELITEITGQSVERLVVP